MGSSGTPSDLIGQFKQVIKRGNTAHPVFQELAREFDALPHHEARKQYVHAVQNVLGEAALSEAQVKACRSSEWRLDIITLSLWEEKNLAPNPEERLELIQTEFDRVTASDFGRKLITLHYCLRSLAELLEVKPEHVHSIGNGRSLFEFIGRKVRRHKGKEIFKDDHIKLDLDRILNAISQHPDASSPTSDIFISYSRKDRSQAEQLAKALEAQGWSVWWDTRLKGGEIWDEVIEGALESVGVVVVLWSRSSIESRWVKREARYADKKRILIPAFIEDVEPPLEFSDVQAENLISWHGGASYPGYARLRTTIEELLKQAPQPQLHEEEVGTVSSDHPDVVVDNETGLMWTRKDNGQDIDWIAATEHAKNLRLGGYADWRLPTIQELEGLYTPKDGGKYNISKPFQLSRSFLWSATKKDSGSAWYFGFKPGRQRDSLLITSYDRRCLCVRRSGE